MRHGACKAQWVRRTKQEAPEQEAPGFGVGKVAAKLKHQISHTKLTAHRPPPSFVC